MSDLYTWPMLKKEMFSSVRRDICVQRQKTPMAGNASNHHYHEAYELYYLYEGERLYYIAGKTYRVPRGSFVLIPPYEMHSTGVATPAGYDRFLLYFSKDYFEKTSASIGTWLKEALAREERIIPVEFQKQRLVETLLSAMLEEYEEHPTGYEHFLSATMTQIFLLIGRSKAHTGINEQYNVDAVHKTISEAVAYINLHYAEQLTLGEMADRFFVSPGYFSHAFKRITGIPFVKYVNGIRIKEAQRLLRTKDVTVAAVAEAVGYTSTTHFGRVFREITGQTPLEYKTRGK